MPHALYAMPCTEYPIPLILYPQPYTLYPMNARYVPCLPPDLDMQLGLAYVEGAGVPQNERRVSRARSRECRE